MKTIFTKIVYVQDLMFLFVAVPTYFLQVQEYISEWITFAVSSKCAHLLKFP